MSEEPLTRGQVTRILSSLVGGLVAGSSDAVLVRDVVFEIAATDAYWKLFEEMRVAVEGVTDEMVAKVLSEVVVGAKPVVPEGDLDRDDALAKDEIEKLETER